MKPHSKNLKILVAEDNPNHAELIDDILQKAMKGVRILFVRTGKETLEALKKRRFHLALLDYHLPDTTAGRILEVLHKERIKTPIIIMTGQGDERMAAQCIQAGAADYINKTRKNLEMLPAHLFRVIDQNTLLFDGKNQRKKHVSDVLSDFFQDLEQMTHSLKAFYKGPLPKLDRSSKPLLKASKKPAKRKDKNPTPKPAHVERRTFMVKLSGIEKQMKNLKRLVGRFI